MANHPLIELAVDREVKKVTGFRKAAIELSGLRVTDLEILRRHYADTLLQWGKRFQENRQAAQDLFDERFCRMWEFYLSATEVGFRYGKQMVFQMQFSKSIGALPWCRDYMGLAEKALESAEPPGGV